VKSPVAQTCAYIVALNRSPSKAVNGFFGYNRLISDQQGVGSAALSVDRPISTQIGERCEANVFAETGDTQL